MRTRNQDQDQASSPPPPPRGSFSWSWSWFLVLSLGCTPSSTAPASAAPADVDLEKFVAVQVHFDATLLKPGQWALYRLKVEGLPRTEIFKWSVVAADAKGLWVENKVPHGETGMVRKSRFDRTGKLEEVWMGPPGGVPAKIWPPPGAAPPPPARPAVPPAFKETAEPATAAGRVFRCTKVSSEASYPDGRKVAVWSWFCPDVPFAGQARYGGLVRRQIGRVTFELLDAGTGIGRPELEIPK